MWKIIFTCHWQLSVQLVLNLYLACCYFLVWFEEVTKL